MILLSQRTNTFEILEWQKSFDVIKILVWVFPRNIYLFGKENQHGTEIHMKTMRRNVQSSRTSERHKRHCICMHQKQHDPKQTTLVQHFNDVIIVVVI